MTPSICVRRGTFDELMAAEVIDQNEYALPDRFLPGDAIIDIGAHIGCFAYACAARGASHIACFEPDDESLRLLEFNAGRLPIGVTVWRQPVWSDNAKLTILSAPQDRSPMTTTTPYLGHGNPKIAWGINHVLGYFGPIRMLKLDVEGAEVPIIEAARPDSCDLVQEIVGELHYEATLPGVRPATDKWLNDQMRRLGFNKVGIKKNPHCPSTLAIFKAAR